MLIYKDYGSHTELLHTVLVKYSKILLPFLGYRMRTVSNGNTAACSCVQRPSDLKRAEILKECVAFLHFIYNKINYIKKLVIIKIRAILH